MSRSKTPYNNVATGEGWRKGAIADLSGRMNQIKRLVRLEGVWYLHDIPEPGSDDSTERTRRYARTVEKLISKGAIRVVERKQEMGKTRRTYEWHREAKADIRAHLHERDELPCECRAHIPDGRDGPDGWYACSHCGAYHRKGVIREAMG